MTFTSTTVRNLRALGLEPEMVDKILEIFEEAKTAKVKAKGGAADRAARGTRLPDDWALPAEWRAAAMQMGLTAREVDREAIKFKNYWSNQPGVKGVKLLWDRTWENWCISTLERAGRTPNPAHGAPAAASAGPGSFDDATWRAIAKRYREDQQWREEWGPPPGRMDCHMPAAYL